MTGWPPLLLLAPLGGQNSFAADAPTRGISTVAPVRPAETKPAGSPAAGRIAENGDSSPARAREGKFGNRVLAEPNRLELKRLRHMLPDRPCHTCRNAFPDNCTSKAIEHFNCPSELFRTIALRNLVENRNCPTTRFQTIPLQEFVVSVRCPKQVH